jgi:isocitrate dehydrogenase (NAD+)
MVRAGAMLLQHIGKGDLARRLEMALDVCGRFERRLVMTGRDDGATSAEFGQYILETMGDDGLERRWQEYQEQLVARR